MTKRHLVIATRESPLALRQAEAIQTLLLAHHPYLAINLLGITTQADKRLDVNLLDIGGKGLFVKELEEALLDGRADIAVHSMKDVPMELPQGLCISAITKREDVRDVFIANQYPSLMQLPHGASVGTSSLRRQTQLQALRRDLSFLPLRGNINTRLQRLDHGELDAIILAAAGLNRMNLNQRIRSYFPPEEVLPAAGQGALGIECREDDRQTALLLTSLNDRESAECVIAERALCRRLGGGCQLPVAAFAELKHDKLLLRGLVANRDGTRFLRAALAGDRTSAEDIGTRVAEVLLQQGAEKILSEFGD